MIAHLPPDKANTLKQAYQVCELGALEGESQKYYVDLSEVRDPTAINSLKKKLDFSEPGQFRSILFTGHRGSGKSTELLRLKNQLEQEYRVVYLKADSVLDINDTDYIDLYLVLIHEIMKEAAELKLKLNSTLVQTFEDWFKEITEETDHTVEKHIGLEAKVGIEAPFLMRLMAKLSAQIKGSYIQRKKVRNTLQQDIGALQANMNALLLNAFEKLREKYNGYSKGFLVMFDNLDRLPLEVADRLYFDYATQLQDINCTLIYTAPISVVYSNKNLNRAFSEPHIIPMVKIYQPLGNDLKYARKALNDFAQVITKRIDYNAVFTDPKLIMELVTNSGGHVRQLMQMMAQACLLTNSPTDKIDKTIIQSVIKKQYINFDRIIPEDHYPLLAQVYQERRVRQTEDGQIMLFNLSVLEYNGDERWNYINPVILQSPRFQKALQQAHQVLQTS
ncbi:MAG: ATP-binding protein [Prochlorotrichaceae cyanobacterium]|jgi:GTPase SAR1 family protein